MPTVSIIIPCFNQGRYLGQAIESCLRQTYQDFEIIVVDDGSTDNTAAAAASYSQVKYIYQANAGPGSARNTGVRYASGKYIQFLDADDVFLPTKFQRCVEILDKEPQMHFVYTDYEWRTHDLTQIVLDRHYFPPFPTGEMLNAVLRMKGAVLLSFLLLTRREWIEKIGGFDETLQG